MRRCRSGRCRGIGSPRSTVSEPAALAGGCPRFNVEIAPRRSGPALPRRKPYGSLTSESPRCLTPGHRMRKPSGEERTPTGWCRGNGPRRVQRASETPRPLFPSGRCRMDAPVNRAMRAFRCWQRAAVALGGGANPNRMVSRKRSAPRAESFGDAASVVPFRAMPHGCSGEPGDACLPLLAAGCGRLQHHNRWIAPGGERGARIGRRNAVRRFSGDTAPSPKPPQTCRRMSDRSRSGDRRTASCPRISDDGESRKHFGCPAQDRANVSRELPVRWPVPSQKGLPFSSVPFIVMKDTAGRLPLATANPSTGPQASRQARFTCSNGTVPFVGPLPNVSQPGTCHYHTVNTGCVVWHT